MSRRPPRKRELSENERRLWEQAMRETTALNGRARGEMPSRPEARPLSAKTAGHQHDEAPQPATNASRGPPPSQPAQESGSPRLAPLARREARRIARDPESIDARLDLHGMRQREAYPALKGFVRASQGRGHRLLLVITGKGTARETGREDYDAWADTPFYEAPRGVLRRLVPEWLSKPEFRDVVAGVSPAHPRHGGEGALYVRLRSAGPRPTTPRSPSKGD